MGFFFEGGFRGAKGTGNAHASDSGTWQTHMRWVSDGILTNCPESIGVKGPWNKPGLKNIFSRNTANLVHSSKSFYCLSPVLTREGPRNAEAAHQAQLIPKLVFLFNEPNLIASKIPTIIGILACQLRGHFSTQDLLRCHTNLPGGRAGPRGCLKREDGPQLSPHCAQPCITWNLLGIFVQG